MNMSQRRYARKGKYQHLVSNISGPSGPSSSSSAQLSMQPMFHRQLLLSSPTCWVRLSKGSLLTSSPRPLLLTQIESLLPQQSQDHQHPILESNQTNPCGIVLCSMFTIMWSTFEICHSVLPWWLFNKIAGFLLHVWTFLTHFVYWNNVKCENFVKTMQEHCHCLMLTLIAPLGVDYVNHVIR